MVAWTSVVPKIRTTAIVFSALEVQVCSARLVETQEPTDHIYVRILSP